MSKKNAKKTVIKSQRLSIEKVHLLYVNILLSRAVKIKLIHNFWHKKELENMSF